MKDIKFIIFEKNETVLESLFKDVVTLIMVAFLVYISDGSTWWTFVTGSMFILFIFAKMKQITGLQKRFKTKAELIAWANTLADT